MATLNKTLRYRLKPADEQVPLLYQHAGSRRWVWNWALRKQIDCYRETGKAMPWKQIETELVWLKKQEETKWLAGIDSQSLQQAIKDLKRAFRNFFEGRAKFPKRKTRKKATPTFRIPQRVVLVNGVLNVPKIGPIRVRLSQEPTGRTKSATFKCDSRGNWYVALVCEEAIVESPVPLPADPDTVVGLDAGFKTYATLSNGECVQNPRYLRKAERKLRRWNRRLARRKLGGRNWRKAKLALARIHHKVADQRLDFMHQEANKLLARYEGICLEDLCTQGMARTKLAKSVHDASLGAFRRIIEYKALRRGRYVRVIDRFYPSSKTCNVCKKKNDALELKDRKWTCAECGTEHDRDLNAARNIKQEGYLQYVSGGLPGTQNAWGGCVRPCDNGATTREPGILGL